MPKKPTNKQADYEELGKQLVGLYETGLFTDSKKKVYKSAFIKGLLAGLGGVIGATIVVGLLLWALSFFEEVPLLGDFTKKVENSIQGGQ